MDSSFTENVMFVGAYKVSDPKATYPKYSLFCGPFSVARLSSSGPISPTKRVVFCAATQVKTFCWRPLIP